MYLYETHCHTAPVSNCGKASAEETVFFYKEMGYDGIFITNHFLDGNINPEARELQYPDQIDYYFSDYEKAEELGKEVGIKVFPGVELSYKGTDFLIYGLEKAWYKAHPEIMDMKKSIELLYLKEAGALVIQAHPYREANYIDHIRLFPRSVHGAEIYNSGQAWESNEPAVLYARHYGLFTTCGSDNHWAGNVFNKLREKGFRPEIAGMCSDTEIFTVDDYILKIKAGTMKMFLMNDRGDLEML